MNAHAHHIIKAALLIAVAAVSAPVLAGEPASVAIDCARPTLPSQRAIGELAGQQNVGQVYATRARVMAEVRRACQRDGTAGVLLVRTQAESPADMRRVASHQRRAK